MNSFEEEKRRFVVRLFHYLAPAIATNKRILVNLGGRGVFDVDDSRCDTFPDLWLTFRGNRRRSLIQTAYINLAGEIMLSRAQHRAWRRGGSGVQPQLWAVCGGIDDRGHFYYGWRHGDFQVCLDAAVPVGLFIRVCKPEKRQKFRSVHQLSSYLLKQAGVVLRPG